MSDPAGLSTWVLVPGAPILLPGVAGATDPAAELRAACLAEVGAALARNPASVTVVASGDDRPWPAEQAYDLGRLTGNPVDGPSVPLALAVGRFLVRAAGWTGPLEVRTVSGAAAREHGSAEPPPGEPGRELGSGMPAPGVPDALRAEVVVAVGDGSLFRHAEGGPGRQHPRAVELDDRVRTALEQGDAAALRRLDLSLAAELEMTGAAPWCWLGLLAGTGPIEARVAFAGDPFGPYALVASWRFARHPADHDPRLARATDRAAPQPDAPHPDDPQPNAPQPDAPEQLSLADLLHRAQLLTRQRRRTLLGIAGSPGAGKSTLAAMLVDRLRAAPPPGAGADWVAHVPMDGFHLADVELDRLGRRARKGAPDTFDGDGYAALLARLVSETGTTVYAPAFERALEQPVAGSIPVPPSVRLVITEGNYLLLPDDPWPRVRAQLAEVWFCAADPERRLGQLTSRHAEFGKADAQAQAWARGPDQRNALLVEATAGQADLVVPDALLRSLIP